MFRPSWYERLVNGTVTRTDFPIHKDTCPIPKGTFYLKDIKLTATKTWPAIIPRGYIQGNGSYYRDDELVGTYSLRALVADKFFR